MSRDPVVLDNTPWWIPGVTTGGAAGLALPRCNAYGHESGGPRHLEGGVYGPDHEPYVWKCTALSDGRWRAVCRHEHRGQVMQLCSGHVMMMHRRMLGACPRCAWPPEALMIKEAMDRTRGDAYWLDYEGREKAAARLWDLQEAMNQLVDASPRPQAGMIHRCPMRLEGVS